MRQQPKNVRKFEKPGESAKLNQDKSLELKLKPAVIPIDYELQSFGNAYIYVRHFSCKVSNDVLLKGHEEGSDDHTS
ncbi:MAG: hypothetical protein AOA66_0610 [Candidatus Bathyarchaeota archaeon BA2]|nr:MAG: hypothetical protein AOA66_0610 [Candidatus Bathyarchaeota archaeon BA2]